MEGESEANSASAAEPPLCKQCRLKLDGVPDYPLVNVPFKIEVSLIDEKDSKVVGPEMLFRVSALYVADNSFEVVSCPPDIVQITPNEESFKIGPSGSVELTVTISELTIDAKDHRKIVLDFKVDQASSTQLSEGVSSVVDARTQPLLITANKLVIEEIATVPYIWYKDEGGHRKCIDARVYLQNASGEIILNRRVPLIATLVYANGLVATPMEGNNTRALLELSNESTMVTDETGIGFVKYRINEVSSTHGRKQFRLLVAPDPAYPENLDISPALTLSVEVKSKRNGRRALLAAQTAAMLDGRDPEEVCPPTKKQRVASGPVLSGRAGILTIGKGGSNGALMADEAISWVNKVIRLVESLKKRTDSDIVVTADMLGDLETHVIGGKATIEATMQNLHTLIISSAAVSDSFPLKLVKIPKAPKPAKESDDEEGDGATDKDDKGKGSKDAKASKAKKEVKPKVPKEPKEQPAKKSKAKGRSNSSSNDDANYSGVDHLSTLSSLALALHRPPVPSPSDHTGGGTGGGAVGGGSGGGGLMSLLAASTSLMSSDAMESSSRLLTGRGRRVRAKSSKAKSAAASAEQESANASSEVDDELQQQLPTGGSSSTSSDGGVGARGKGGKNKKTPAAAAPAAAAKGDSGGSDNDAGSQAAADFVAPQSFSSFLPAFRGHAQVLTRAHDRDVDPDCSTSNGSARSLSAGKQLIVSIRSQQQRSSSLHEQKEEEEDGEQPKKKNKGALKA